MSISRFTNVLIYSLLTLSSPAHTVGEQCALSTATPILLHLTNCSLPTFPVALVLDAPNSSISQLGLANNSVFLHLVVKAGFSSVAGFGLLAGSQSVSNPRDGHLILGGYDAASLAGPFHTYPMSNTTHAGSHVCSLQVEVETLILRRPKNDDVYHVTGGTPMYSCIEPLFSHSLKHNKVL
jgi:hypothetical protein